MQLLYFVIICSNVIISCAMEPVVKTKLGSYKGHYVKTLSGREVTAFNGIRYAKPPVNQLRFKEPQKIEAHDGIYDATKDGDDCLQFSDNYTKYSEEEMVGKKYVGSEDCLFLNVYTPNINPAKKYPVIVHIHGGSFISGTSASNWHGPQMLLDKDVVLVALNYRLGILGFLPIDDEILQGNLGLKDQSLALSWVKDHIESFGGDPDMITVMGHSAGGVCANLQMISPRNKGIIKRTIILSGTIDCPFVIFPKTHKNEIVSELSTILNCPNSPTALLACLQEKTSEEIMEAVEKLNNIRPKFEFVFLPVFETMKDGFITEDDYKRGSKMPLMIGITKDDGAISYKALHKAGDTSLKYFNSQYKKFLANVFQFNNHPNADDISEMIKKEYFGEEEIVNNIDQFIEMMSDGLFIYGTVETTKRHKGDSYLYMLTHQGVKSLTNDLPIEKISHADELFYLFPYMKTPDKLEFNEEDAKVQKLFVELWTNFAIYGNPTPDGSRQWNESEKGKNYVRITPNGIEPDQYLHSERMNFWHEIFTNQIKRRITIDEL